MTPSARTGPIPKRPDPELPPFPLVHRRASSRRPPSRSAPPAAFSPRHHAQRRRRTRSSHLRVSRDREGCGPPLRPHPSARHRLTATVPGTSHGVSRDGQGEPPHAGRHPSSSGPLAGTRARGKDRRFPQFFRHTRLRSGGADKIGSPIARDRGRFAVPAPGTRPVPVVVRRRAPRRHTRRSPHAHQFQRPARRPRPDAALGR